MRLGLPDTLALALAALLVALPAAAQSRPSLVGVWRYVRERDSTTDGHRITYMPDSGFAGRLVYTANGRMAALILPTAPLPDSGPSPLDLSTSYFGSYRVDWAMHTVTHYVEGSILPESPMPRYTRVFAIRGDTLTLTGDWIYDGRPARFTILWVREE